MTLIESLKEMRLSDSMERGNEEAVPVAKVACAASENHRLTPESTTRISRDIAQVKGIQLSLILGGITTCVRINDVATNVRPKHHL